MLRVEGTHSWLKLGRILSYRDLTRQVAEDEATGMYLCRVPVRQYPPQRPHCLVEEAPVTYVVSETLRVAHPLTPCKMDTIAPHYMLCRAKLKQSHHTTMCSLRYTVHPEHNPEHKKAVPGSGTALKQFSVETLKLQECIRSCRIAELLDQFRLQMQHNFKPMNQN